MTVRRTAAGLVCGALLALVVFAPASWLANALNQASQRHLLLADAQGSVWAGNAVFVLTGGSNSQTAVTLPGRVHWHLGLDNGLPALRLVQPCCVTGELVLRWQPGWHVQRLSAYAWVRSAATASSDGRSALWGQWPASVLVGLGQPWNSIQPSGTLQLSSQRFELLLSAGSLQLDGQLDLVLRDVSTQMSTLSNVGSFQLQAQGRPENPAVSLQLNTLRGSLQVQGQGHWTASGLSFRGLASAAPDAETALNNLLNMLGRREGGQFVISIG